MGLRLYDGTIEKFTEPCMMLLVFHVRQPKSDSNAQEILLAVVISYVRQRTDLENLNLYNFLLSSAKEDAMKINLKADSMGNYSLLIVSPSPGKW